MVERDCVREERWTKYLYKPAWRSLAIHFLLAVVHLSCWYFNYRMGRGQLLMTRLIEPMESGKYV